MQVTWVLIIYGGKSDRVRMRVNSGIVVPNNMHFAKQFCKTSNHENISEKPKYLCKKEVIGIIR